VKKEILQLTNIVELNRAEIVQVNNSITQKQNQMQDNFNVKIEKAVKDINKTTKNQLTSFFTKITQLQSDAHYQLRDDLHKIR
jgi:hypothetical protein